MDNLNELAIKAMLSGGKPLRYNSRAERKARKNRAVLSHEDFEKAKQSAAKWLSIPDSVRIMSPEEAQAEMYRLSLVDDGEDV